MPRNREYATDDLSLQEGAVAHSSFTPTNEWDALMQCAPHESPDVDAEALEPVREALDDAIQRLPARERFVFEGCVIERRALRDIAKDLNMHHSNVAKIRDRAARLLAEELEGNPIIKEFLK